MFGYMHGVLNEVYLQNFLYGWAVSSLDSSRDLQSIPAKGFVNIFYLVLRNSKTPIQNVLSQKN